jgi:hypothetical protein
MGCCRFLQLPAALSPILTDRFQSGRGSMIASGGRTQMVSFGSAAASRQNCCKVRSQPQTDVHPIGLKS